MSKKLSFQVVEFKKIYGLSYRLLSNDCKFFVLFGSTGSASYVISGFIHSSNDESFVVTGLESSHPKDAFYSSLPDFSSVTDLSLILHGYSPEDSVITDFCNYLEEKLK